MQLLCVSLPQVSTSFVLRNGPGPLTNVAKPNKATPPIRW
jgi:hypothetical protein